MAGSGLTWPGKLSPECQASLRSWAGEWHRPPPPAGSAGLRELGRAMGLHVCGESDPAWGDRPSPGAAKGAPSSSIPSGQQDLPRSWAGPPGSVRLSQGPWLQTREAAAGDPPCVIKVTGCGRQFPKTLSLHHLCNQKYSSVMAATVSSSIVCGCLFHRWLCVQHAGCTGSLQPQHPHMWVPFYR